MASGAIRLFVLRKNDAVPLASTRVSRQEPDRQETIGGFVVTEHRGSSDVEVLVVTSVEVDEQATESGSPETESVRIYSVSLGAQGFSTPDMLQEIDVQTVRRLDIRSVHLTSEGRVVAMGRDALLTASSTSGPFTLSADAGFYGEDFVEVDRGDIRHAIPGNRTMFSFGDAFEGLFGLFNSAPEIGGVFLGAAYDPERDLVFSSTEVPRFVVHDGESWTERFLAVPENAELCRNPMSPCGFQGIATSNDLESALSTRVDRLGVVPRPSGGVLLAFRPRSCRGVFLADLDAQCAIAAPIDDDTILIEEWRGSRTVGHYALDWDGYVGLMAGPNAAMIEITVTPPDR
jgi:hypothetical protein